MMPRMPIRIALVAGTCLVPLLGGGLFLAPAATATAAKTQDRIAPQDGDGAVQMAAMMAQGPGMKMGPGMNMGPGAGPAIMGPAAMGSGDGDGPTPPPPGHPRGPHGGAFLPSAGPLGTARALAAAEVAIGIRASQIDTWRDFTDALQDVAPPPAGRPPGTPPAPNGPEAESPGTAPAPFVRTLAFASRIEQAGKAGARLAQAAEALKAHLTPDQLERLARIEPMLLPPPPPRHGPPTGGPPEDRLPPR